MTHINRRGQTRSIFLFAARSRNRRWERKMKVKDVMHKGVQFAEQNTPIKEIAKQMRDFDIGAMPVTAKGHIVGIITDRDLTCRALADGADLSQLTAKDVMTKNAICCSPEDDVKTAVQTMEAKRIRRLAVTDEHHAVLGMLTLGDISYKLSKQASGEVLRAVSAHHG
ncbi:MAG: CBS domain-containing protein [Methylovirgula sp.]